MLLKETYEARGIHDGWEAAYRGNALQDRLNARIMDRVLAVAAPAPGALFLDAGCGVGYHTQAIARRGYRCVGIDISEHILAAARRDANDAGLACQPTFQCEELENLSFADATFDVVHCRGVLMHIPRWQRAAGELCRVLKPGGSIIIMESNEGAVETRLVQLARRLRSAKSRLVAAPGGLEFWSEVNGQPFLVRIADIQYLVAQLRKLDVEVVKRFATEFWDIYRFPPGALRNAAIRFNHLWFRFRLPGSLSIGNALIGRKRTRGFEDEKVTR